MQVLEAQEKNQPQLTKYVTLPWILFGVDVLSCHTYITYNLFAIAESQFILTVVDFL